ncbi:MAG: hypothetical protein JSV09_09405 [Thermoplasmata archaeon]|nr:MAG: hypothetical protein JSV09_09405 [Thermoplasmata archaeon]
MARALNLSQAQARTLLRNLGKRDLVNKFSPRLGHCLSSKGKTFWKKCLHFFQIPHQRIHLGPRYTMGTKDAAVCVEATGIEQLNTVILRDEALMNGAMGCTVFLHDLSGEFFLLDAIYPPLPKTTFSDRKSKRKLSRLIAGIAWPKVIIIVGTANHVVDAQIGAISAALLLVPEEIRYFFQDVF